MASGSVFGKLFGKGFGKGFSQFSFKQSFKHFGKSGFGQSLKGVPKGVGAWSGRWVGKIGNGTIRGLDTQFGKSVGVGIGKFGTIIVGVVYLIMPRAEKWFEENNVPPEVVATGIGVITISIALIAVTVFINSTKKTQPQIIMMPSEPIDSNSKTPAV